MSMIRVTGSLHRYLNLSLNLRLNLLHPAMFSGLLLAVPACGAHAQQKSPAPLTAPVKAPQPAPPAGGQTPGAQPLELRMKFLPGDISKYQMTMQAILQMPGQPQGATTQYDTKINMIVQQKVLKVMANGNADVAVSTLSGDGMVNGKVFKPDTVGKPSIITFDTRNNIVSAKSLPKSASGSDVTAKLFQSGALSTQGVYLPKQPVKIGDKWSQKVSINGLESATGGSVQTTFVRIEPVGTFSTARLHSVMHIPFLLTNAESKQAVPLKGMLTMIYDSNLAIPLGKVIRSTGDGDISVFINMPSPKPPKTTATKSDASKSGSKSGKPSTGVQSAPTPAPQKVTVKLRLGNNLITQ